MTGPAASAPFPLLPRSPVRRALAIAAAYLALTAAFVVARFPIERVTPRVAALAGAATGARVEIGSLGIDLIALLPALHAREVTVAWPTGTRLRLDRVRARPAWSLSWLRGHPSVLLSLRAGESRVDGVVRLGPEPAFRGELAQLDLKLLPPSLLGGTGLDLDGRLDGALDVRMTERGPEGAVRLHAAGGSLALPVLPIGVPFETADAELTLGGDALVTIGSLAVDGPMVALQGHGTVGRGAMPSVAPLALQARLEVREPALRDMLDGSEVRLGPDGQADLSIGGTLASPQLGAGAGGRPGLPARAPRAP